MIHRREIDSIKKLSFFGISTISIGLLLIIISLKLNKIEGLKSLCSHLGSGFLVAGILTVAVERTNQKRIEKNIIEIKNASAEAVIIGLMPVCLFDEIQTMVIKNPFLRESWKSEVVLTWTDSYKDFLWWDETYSYTIKNNLNFPSVYQIRVFEENLFNDSNSEAKILYVSCKDPLNKVCPIVFNLQGNIKEITGGQEFETQILLDSEQTREITCKIRIKKAKNDFYSYILFKPTKGLNINLTHPGDLVFDKIDLHSKNFEIDDSKDNTLVYTLSSEIGLLPFEGIQIFWKKKT